MQRYQWSRLNRQQTGKYTEYFVKMELTMHGFQVYGSEVDDRGSDFVARFGQGPFLRAQAKSVRSLGYVLMRRHVFVPSDDLYPTLAILLEDQPPELFLISSTAWNKPTALFVSRDYTNPQSDPEWGLNLSNRNMPSLAPYRFEPIVRCLTGWHPQAIPDMNGTEQAASSNALSTRWCPKWTTS